MLKIRIPQIRRKPQYELKLPKYLNKNVQYRRPQCLALLERFLSVKRDKFSTSLLLLCFFRLDVNSREQARMLYRPFLHPPQATCASIVP